MESPDTQVSWLNMPSPSLEHTGLESKLQWTVQESCGLPILSGMESSPQLDQQLGAFEANAFQQRAHLRSEQCVSASAYAAPACCPEQLKSVDGNSHAQSANSAGLAADLVTAITGDNASVLEKHNWGAWNGGVAQELEQVQLLDGLEVQYSEACSKRFIIFDQTRSGVRVIVHPSVVYEFPNQLTESAKGLDKINVYNKMPERESISEIPSVFNSTIRDGLLAYREHMTPAFTAMQGIRKRRSLSAEVAGNGFVACSEHEETGSQISCNGSSRGDYQSQSHEDTRDLEALLGSDEEEDDSTGHTPSEAITNDQLSSTQDDAHISNDIPTKKRRCECMEFREQEVDFIPSAIQGKAVLNGKCSSDGVCFPHVASQESGIQLECCNIVKDSDYSDEKFCDYSTDNMTGNGSSNNSAAKVGQPSSWRKSRKEKMKKAIDLFRSIVPEGHSMDTAVVLNAASQYLKSLQLRVEMLEANQNDRTLSKP